jgi:hypothetical protein
MAEGQIKIVFEPAAEGLYRAVVIEDDKGNRLAGSWQDTRPWSKDHAVRIIWAAEPEIQGEDLCRIVADGREVSEVLDQQDNPWKRPTIL